MPPALQATPVSLQSGSAEDVLRLPLYGPARLEFEDQTIRLRRKSLAILYYLALEGVVRRQALADLLWDQVDSSQNLRVELHHLRKTLAAHGFTPFKESRDPLTLPDGMWLDRSGGNGEPLEGLEGLTSAFQGWLEQRRAVEVARRSEGFVHRELVRETSRRVKRPYLLILSGQPLSGQQLFTASLASALGLPLTDELVGGRPALHYLSAARRYGDADLDAMLRDKVGVWVIEKPRFSEDSDFLLQLRSSFPPDRVSYLQLPPLTWQEVRDQLLATRPFGEAAHLYLTSGGHTGYLRELTLLGDPRNGASPSLPQRIRAAYQLEARHLSAGARFALERASVHPGPLAEGLLTALEVDEHLVELERRNWLMFDRGWRFDSPVTRSVIYLSLSRGHSRLYHKRASLYFEEAGQGVAAAYHRWAMSGHSDWRQVAAHTEGWARQLALARTGEAASLPAVSREVISLEEQPLLESSIFGEHVEAGSGEIVISRQSVESGSSGAEWQLPVPSGLLHLRGRVHARNSLDVGLYGDAVPLQVEFLGRGVPKVIFIDGLEPQALTDGTLLLPLEEELDCFLNFENSHILRLSSSAEWAIMELTLTVLRTAESGRRTSGPDDDGTTGMANERRRAPARAVNAFDLCPRS